ncbi:carboxypeptidase-like regulatory domain-containing protein [Winogradskyella eckloniae]|uniref:carboxypeptidase-like regulatory domain-containing protein n=1 Tax=Winogradskyella eckloniae TaxID=1089306 RepID=UPI0015631556|nr:carboxypeptidase-like regulatory domain-containing protein [Winogradskyella eckloniae]NRD21194.1 carboxypeptidase-like regulatory domain-containing protein [Winogradskyella eckloniae]
MRKVITISIPEPCHEDWNTMTPQTQGRHCAVCDKTVVDFSKQTDEQIITALETNSHLCGRFKTEQIDRDMVLARKNKNNYISWVASGLLAFLAIGNQSIYAQGKPNSNLTETTIRPTIGGKIATSILVKQKIYGMVTEAERGKPLVGVSIVVKSTNQKIETDFDGKYTIAVKKDETLIFSFLGYISQEIKVKNAKHINIKLQSNELEILGEVNVVAGGIRVYDHNTPTHALSENNQVQNGSKKRTTIGKFFYGIKRLFSKK